MKKLWIILSVVVVVALAIVLILTQTKKEANEIKIGVVLPLSGDGAAYGQKEREGIDLAVEKVNKAGGVNGSKIVAIYEDSQGSPTPAVSATQKLITQNKVKVIIGDAFSSPTLAMVPITDKNKIILMSPTASSPKLSGSNEYFFRIWPSDVAEGSIMAEIAFNQLKLRSYGVFSGNNEYSQGLKNVFEATVSKMGGSILISELYNEGDKDFRTQLAKIKAKSPEAIYLAGYYKEFALILNQIREMGIKTQVLSCGTFHEPEILKTARIAAEGVIFVQPYFDRKNPDPVVQRFVDDYEKKFKSEAGVYAAHAYDALMVLSEAMKNVWKNTNDIRDNILRLKAYPGATGKITFIAGGDVIKPLRVMTVRNGQFTDFSK